MLDILVTAFVVLGFLFLVLDREWIERRTRCRTGSGAATPEDEGHTDSDLTMPGDTFVARGAIELPPDRAPSPIFRPWRLATGVALGAAAATKWSGALALLAAVVLSVMWERTRRAHLGIRRPVLDAVRDEGFSIFVFLLLLPIAVYLASYVRSGWTTASARAR